MTACRHNIALHPYQCQSIRCRRMGHCSEPCDAELLALAVKLQAERNNKDEAEWIDSLQPGERGRASAGETQS